MPENNSNPTVVNGSSNLEIAQSNQDLIISKGRTNKRKWIITAVIVVIAVGLIIAAIILLSKGGEKSNVRPKANSLTLEDYLNGKFRPKFFNGTWTPGGELIYSTGGDILLLNLETNTTRVLINNTDSILATAFDFKLSPDGLYLLVAFNYQKLYRHSFIALYLFIDLRTGEKIPLLPDGVPSQLVVWAPVGNALVYVFENNIYYKSSVKNPPVPVTSTTGYVSNGVPDWVYEEEVLNSNKAVWFSPDGKKLAFGRYNDTNVPIMVLPVYGEPGKINSQYPKANLVKYPKSGTTNPTVTLHYVDLSKPSTENQLKSPVDFNGEEILATLDWGSNNILTAIWLNRVQNKSVLISYDTEVDPAKSINVKNVSSEKGWLDFFTPPIFNKDGSNFVLIVSQDQGGNAGGFKHIVMFNTTVENSPLNALTNGKYIITSILNWNHKNNLIYYLANTEENFAIQHLYTISPVTKEIKCLSCNLTSLFNKSTECSYNTAEFSDNKEYYVLTCSGPDVPYSSIFNKDGTKVVDWTHNYELAQYFSSKAVPILKKLTFDIADGFQAHVLLRLPPDIDTSGKVKYPMLVNVYGGPDTYQVVDRFTLDWGSYLASNKSIIYAAIDGRGSGLKGDNIMFSGYRNLGTVEVIDQINVTKLIQKSLPYVDSSRTAIWGWSYGGYASGMALAKDTENVFKCGISVAPVTDWALYDSIYTERFMGLPSISDNAEGYEKSQLLKNFEGLKNKEYFLIHGTHDDNVHYQQSMMWSKVLEHNDILFRQQSYPDEDHSLGSVRPHLYHSLGNFLDECFNDNKN